MYIPDRESGFPKIINERNYQIGIEIGVRDGIFSEVLLENTPIELYGLDLQITDNLRNKLSRFGNKSILVEGNSHIYYKNFGNEFFDFIYIDADHSFEGCYKDISLWWPKVKNGGMMAGDDYTFLTNPSEGIYGVVQAVDSFTVMNNLKYYVTGAGNDSQEEKHRVARGMGKIIESGLRRQISITFGHSNIDDDIRIPNWFMFKE